MCHPGNKSEYFDEFNQSIERVNELNYLMNHNLHSLLKQVDIDIKYINYSEFK